MRVVRHVGIVAFIGWVFIACGDDSGGSSECEEGASCRCDDGELGERRCTDGVRSCDCSSGTGGEAGSVNGSAGDGGLAASGGSAGSAGKGGTSGTGGATGGSAGAAARGGSAGVSGGPACEPWEPARREACFEPCGGDPVGQWIQEEMCNRDAPADTAGCESIHVGVGTANLALEFLQNGRVTLLGREQRSQSIVLSASCAAGCPDQIAEPGLLAFREQGTRLFCNEAACGECICNDPAASNEWAGGNWLADGSVLVLDSDYEYLPLEYCVNGDEMWLGREARGMSYRFRRAACAGNPLPCAERSADECTGDPEEGGCTLGHCEQVAPDDLDPCLGLEQNECTLLAECAWNEGCGGVAWSDCSFSTCYEPGCSFVPPETPCVGEATACDQRTAQECTGGGCTLGTCAPFDGSEDGFLCSTVNFVACDTVQGCTLTPDYDCIGTFECAGQADSYSCEFANCEWTPAAACTGTAAPCETLDPSACSQQPGCAIDGP